ncbi:hypothetical protein DXT87_18160 [Arthrobacter sp. AET 35A]|nr:hypothetical protein [Arthrobacter sp. AET 35A]
MAVHSTVTGGKQGRQWATEQLNHATILRLASEFQGFSRDLHNEALTFILDTGVTANSAIEGVLRANLEFGRKLDRGNANKSNLGNDFVRLGLPIVEEIKASSAMNANRLEGLDRLNDARNAIAHNNPIQLATVIAVQPLTMRSAKKWRGQLNGLAVSMDRHVGAYLEDVTKKKPW